jgi:hypothetical protein
LRWISGASAPRRQSSEILHVCRQSRSRKARRVGVGGHPLKVGQRARRGSTGVEQAHDRADIVLFEFVEASVQTGLVKAPIPIPRRRGEEQYEEVAAGEAAADLAPPIQARRDVDAGHEAINLLRARGEAFQGLLHLDRECVIVLFVA